VISPILERNPQFLEKLVLQILFGMFEKWLRHEGFLKRNIGRGTLKARAGMGGTHCLKAVALALVSRLKAQSNARTPGEP
jgi:hypothetical protein